MGVGAGPYMYVVVVQKFTFAISSPDEFLYYYRVVFGYIDLQASDFFEMAPLSTTRGHIYKLYKKRSSAVVRQKFFSERIVNI